MFTVTAPAILWMKTSMQLHPGPLMRLHLQLIAMGNEITLMVPKENLCTQHEQGVANALFFPKQIFKLD